MEAINSKITHFLFNVWLGFITLLLLSSYFPHWPNVNFQSWFNGALYFFLFILTLGIIIKEQHNRDIFVNLSIFFFVVSFSFLNIFIGDDFLFGNNTIGYYMHIYKNIFYNFAFQFFIIYTVIKYTYSKLHTAFKYIISLTILGCVYCFNFLPYFLDSTHIKALKDRLYIDLNQHLLNTSIFSLLFILIYGYLLYRKDRLIGTYINSLIACFFIFLVSNIMSQLSEVYQFGIYKAGQYILTLNLCFLCFVLVKKLYFLSSEYGQFYESLINQRILLGNIKIKRHRSEVNAKLFRFLKYYIYHRRNYILGLTFISILILFYYNFPTYFTLNLVALVFCFTLLFIFINILYKRRARRKYLIT